MQQKDRCMLFLIYKSVIHQETAVRSGEEITCFPAGLQRTHGLTVLLCLILSNLIDVRIINGIFSAFHPT